MTARTILVIDDNENLRERLARAFGERGLVAHTAAEAESGLRVTREHQPDYVVLDLKMPGRSGLEVLGELLAASPRSRVVVLTGYGSIPTAMEAVRHGAYDYLSKPADADMILAALQKAPGAPSADYEAPSLARAEWEHIQRVLGDCGGNVSEAARRLGLHRRTLQRKLGSYAPK